MSAFQLLDMGAQSTNYLRAFTMQCWLPVSTRGAGSCRRLHTHLDVGSGSRGLKRLSEAPLRTISLRNPRRTETQQWTDSTIAGLLH